MTQGRLRVAAVQAESVAGEVERNVAVAAEWVGKATAQGAQLVVLPELFLPGYDPKTLREQPGRCDVTPEDERIEPLAAAARESDVPVIVGASLRRHDGARSLALMGFAASGDVSVLYAKQHLWDAERAIFTPGSGGSSVLLGDWCLGLGICYDGCFPEHARAAADDGALVYVCPSAYVVGSEHRRDLYYAARAIDNGIYVVYAGLIGRCGELEFNGGTAVYDPQGRAVDRVTSGEGMVVVDLDPAEIDEARRINTYQRDRPVSLGKRAVIELQVAATPPSGQGHRRGSPTTR